MHANIGRANAPPEGTFPFNGILSYCTLSPYSRQMWTAHNKGVSAMQFSPNGDYLATYCNAQASLKV